MEEQHNNYQMVSEDELQVGNHDSILLFGCSAQQQLRDFSKSISNQLLNSNGNIEYLIYDILKEIEGFQGLINKKSIFPFERSDKKRDLLIKKYNAVLVYIDKMELALKLQEAQIIKDSKVFEELSMNLEEVLTKLVKIISYGNEVVKQQPDICDSEEIRNWYERLSKKIEDLEISHTVAFQCQAQISLMLENNTQLIDKIVGAVSGTIPIWRNQISILLGIERMNRNLMIQNKVAEITQNSANRGGKDKKLKEISVDKLLATNETLKKVIDELDVAEKRDGDIRLELSSSLR